YKANIEDQGENTYNTFKRVINRAAYIENELEKDLYDFNAMEIERVLRLFNHSTLNSVETTFSVISSYLRWAMEEGLRKDNINPLDILRDRDYLKKFINSNVKRLFTKDDINSIMRDVRNPQDNALIDALFNGIMGKKYSELLNLTKYDIDETNNKLKLKNEINEKEVYTREIEVDKSLIRNLLNAAEQTNYYKANGSPSEGTRNAIQKLQESPYVFRTGRSGKYKQAEEGKAHSALVSRRLKTISEYFGFPDLTPINVRNSGMVYMAYQLSAETGKLAVKHKNYIYERFGIYTSENDRPKYHLAQDFLNIETVNLLYGNDDEE
ncbi:hypothetical protein, partial [Paenibacillus sp. Marseille-Q4541]|uniref:phage lytic cycle repressor MrpR family protein n=1 Tax=Paenibacillus sp. Marseille-Q4541 TaxID=2831522 RepID=UPI001BAD4C93